MDEKRILQNLCVRDPFDSRFFFHLRFWSVSGMSAGGTLNCKWAQILVETDPPNVGKLKLANPPHEVNIDSDRIYGRNRNRNRRWRRKRCTKKNIQNWFNLFVLICIWFLRGTRVRLLSIFMVQFTLQTFTVHVNIERYVHALVRYGIESVEAKWHESIHHKYNNALCIQSMVRRETERIRLSGRFVWK